MPIRINPSQPPIVGSPEGAGPIPAGPTAQAGGHRSGGGYRSITQLPEIYSTAAVVEAFKWWTPPEMFLLNNFFGNTRYFQSRFLAIETRKARRVLAPVVSRYAPGVPVKRPAIKTEMYEVPKLAPYRTTMLGELDVRSYGGIVANREGNAADAFAEILADDTRDLEDIIFRRAELFASQILFNGRVRYRLDGGEYEEFGYGPRVPYIYNPAVPWDDPAATPITDLKEVRRQIIADCGVAPDVVVFSDATADLFTNNDQVLTQLDKLHYVVGSVSPRPPTQITGTAQYLGRLLLPTLDMWTYSEAYLDEFDGTTLAPMIPEHAAIVGCTGLNSGFTFWGSILQMDDGGFTESGDMQLIPRLVFDMKNESSEYRLQSRPALVPWDVASWRVINCVAPPPFARQRTQGERKDIERKLSPAIPTEESEPAPKVHQTTREERIRNATPGTRR